MNPRKSLFYFRGFIFFKRFRILIARCQMNLSFCSKYRFIRNFSFYTVLYICISLFLISGKDNDISNTESNPLLMTYINDSFL